MYYFITLLFVFLSSRGSFFYFSNIWWILIDLTIIWVGLEKGRFTKSDVKLFAGFSVIYITFCTIRALFLTHLSVGFWASDILFLFKFILTSFLYCAVVKEKSVYYLTKVIIQLAIISLPFYFLQLISGDLVYAIGQFINLPPHINGGYTNFLVFTYVKVHAIRNSGFSWEPGAFGFFLNIALLMRLLTNGFTFDKKAIWLGLAVATTLSTTSYIALWVVIFLYFRANGVKFSKLMFFIVPVALVLAFQLPFLVNKISFIYANDSQDMTRIEFLSGWYYKHGQQMPLNRFSSMIYLCQLFGANMIWGVSNIYEETVPILKNINISNGIFEYMAKFGLIGLVFFLSRCYLFFRKFTTTEISLYCLLMILVLGFSESIFLISLTICFFFLYRYSDPVGEAESVPLAPEENRNISMGHFRRKLNLHMSRKNIKDQLLDLKTTKNNYNK
ncbi:MAG TPA: hypothetical protein VNW95_00180 [Mucilaginibacter sp.]|jgi:hypothetical protein|nr:hypothetical protein [Mucilaginibacter sp.]